MPNPNCKNCRFSISWYLRKANCPECPNYDFTDDEDFTRSMTSMRYQQVAARIDNEDEVPRNPKPRAAEDCLQIEIPAWLERVGKERYGD